MNVWRIDPWKQPLFSEDNNLFRANGEIYNHRALRKQFEGNTTFKQVIGEVILALYKKDLI
jgi:asparagine synthase (glutamine-hydrolysing)